MKKSMSEYFDDYSKYYDLKIPSTFFKRNHVWLLNELGDVSGKKILDVGCGTGELLYVFENGYKNVEAHGLDISPKMLEKAKERTSNVEYKEGNVEKLPYDNDTFDIVVNSASFHHYENPQKALEEMRRVLKPGGKLYVLDSVRDYGPISFLPYYWDFVEAKQCYTKHLKSKRFKELFKIVGFNNICAKRYFRFNFVIYLLISGEK